MMSKKEFLDLYNYTVNQVKKIKASNDILNKGIGIQNDFYLLSTLQKQNEDMKQDFFQIDQNIKKLEKNYLDPDTSRKMGTLKQQYHLQSERRLNLSLKIKNDFQKKTKGQTIRGINSAQVVQSRYRIEQQNKRPNLHVNTHLKNQPKQVKKYQIQHIKQNIQDIQIQHYDLQHKLLATRTQTLKQMEKNMSKIQNITNQTLKITAKQGENLDIITQDMNKAQENVFKGKQQIDQAQIKQKKSKKKYIIASIILIILAIIIIIFIII